MRVRRPLPKRSQSARMVSRRNRGSSMRITLAFGALLTFALCGCGTARPPLATASDHTIVHSSAGAASIRDEADATVRGVTHYLNITQPESPARIVHFRWWLPRRLYLGSACPRMADAAATCFANEDGELEIVFSGSWDAAETRRLLRHELTHYLVASRWRGEVPPWLDEGLSRFFELGPPYGRPHPKSLNALRKKLRGPSPDMLADLIQMPPGQRLTRAQYDAAWGLTWFLLTSPDVGPSAVTAYADDVRWPDDPSERFRLHFGASPAEMADEWHRAILAATP